MDHKHVDHSARNFLAGRIAATLDKIEGEDVLIMETQPVWYTKQEMLACASSGGFTVSEGLFEDWVDKGLLGLADQREWPGRGHGSTARWSRLQLDLFLTLLQQRQQDQGGARIGHLSTVPVWKWLYWGEMGGVSLDQVRKAMRTWIEFRRNLPRAKIRKEARELVHLTRDPLAVGVRDLIDLLTDAATFDEEHEPLGREELHRIVEPIMSAYPKRAQNPGPVKAFFDDAAYFSTMIPLRLEALEAYQDLKHLPDAVWEWARTLLLVTVIQGVSAHSFLATDPELAYRFPRRTVDELCESSCYYLLTMLAIAQQHAFIGSERGEDWLYLDPRLWERGEVTSSIRTHEVRSILLLPGGEHVPYLRNDITIVPQRGEQQHFSLDLPFL